MTTKLETLAGYKVGQTVKFVDPCYGLMEGTIIKIFRYGKDKALMVKIEHSNKDLYNFTPIRLNEWN